MPGQIIGADAQNATLKVVKKFGVRWNKTQSPTALERINNSIGLSFTPARGGVGGSSGFDIEPIYKDIRLCNMQNGVVTAYQGDAGFRRDSAAGVDVMVEIPRFYYKITDTATTRDFEISDQPLDGFLPSPRHAPRPGKPGGSEKIYVSAYTVNNSYQSRTGNTSQVSMTRAAARTGCTGRGAAQGYCQYDFATYMTIMLLYIVEVADWNSQAAVGDGYTSGNSAQIATGDTDGVIFHSGSVGAAGVTNRSVKYRHMENLWGNLHQFVDGINFDGRQPYICTDPTQYADSVTTTPYEAVSYQIPASAWITALGFDPAFPWAQMPSAGSGGSDGTYIPDYVYSSASGDRVLYVGGAWNAAAYAGLFCFYAHYAPTIAGTYIGARLLVLP